MEIVRKDTESDLLMDVFFADVLKGDTPFIGENGHWWIGLTDTGVTARGVDGYMNIIVSRTEPADKRKGTIWIKEV